MMKANQVIINLEESKRLYEIYKSRTGDKVPAIYEFKPELSIVENLNQLSFISLTQTLSNYYSFNTIFLDLISRWIEHTEEFESEYQRVYKLSYTVKGSIVLHSLSKLIGISNESINLMEYYLTTNNVLNNLQPHVDDITHQELEFILLSYYRLVNFDLFKFGKFVDPKILYAILASSSPSNVAKYLSVLILSVYLQSSETVLHEMIQQHTNNDLDGSYDDEIIDYKFLNLSEAKRLSNFHNLPKLTHSLDSKLIIIEPSILSNLVTSIFGILVPNFNKDPSLELSEFVATKSSIKVLKNLALNIQNNKPTMLYGEAGSGKTFLFNQLSKLMGNENSIIKIHLGEQTDAKLLLGTYSSGEKPGTFKWRSGVLTTAVKEGKWVLIEDIDKAPTEVLSILLTLLEKRQLIIPSRGEIIKAHNNFQIISTIRTTESSNAKDSVNLPDLIGLRLWSLIKVEIPSQFELISILSTKFPLLKSLIKKFLLYFNEVLKIYSSNNFINLNKGSHPRTISIRDLIKFCSRCNKILTNNNITNSNELLESSIFDQFFQEAIDCFGSSLTDYNALIPLSNITGEYLEIAPSRINLYLTKHIPQFFNDDYNLKIGRAILPKSNIDNTLNKFSKSSNITAFARTNHSLRLMEQISVSIEMIEPILLVGETGTGKTTVVQQIAKLMNKKLTVINVSQQTESGDLLGGYKPVNTKIIAIPLQEVFENLFITTFSKKKNEKFSNILTRAFNKNQWKNVIKLWKEAIKMSKNLLSKEIESDNDESNNDVENDQPKKKRKLKSHERKILLDKWIEFELSVKDFEIQSNSLDNSFVFNFVEGSLVQAIRNGDWLLLDEINLASSDTLESIADLLDDSIDQRSILLSEKGDIEPIKAHADFRIFGCMNPSTDVGKKDLPLSIRSRFTEIYVHSPDRDINDLLAIIDKYIGRFALSDEWVGQDIAELYLAAKNLSESNKIVDGANQKPHFSIRTLTRTLLYVVDIVSIYGLRRSLYEGFCMSFLTLLDLKSEKLLKPIIEKYTIGKLKNQKSVMKQLPPCPSKSNPEEYVQFKHYWMKHGPEQAIPQPHYIITPFVEKNMLNLVRATAGRRFPVLIQGPTSAGKTSMIQYLANITGHKFVRINNHEHTDLQEYLGTYISDTTGKLVFKEGILVEAIRKGYWIVLDELNLAPTDILEALNRLLDDNRELFIPETQEVVHPHPDFMLFATQNPPGIYGGRKMLSRAFRNRFLELHFDDIPQDELEIILKERCKIAPSYGKRIVEVYKQLTIQRQSTRLFEQKNSFATLRDLFRWALREAVGYEELAANGYMLLAERVRKPDEKLVVKQTIEKVMKVKLDMDKYYESLESSALINFDNTDNSIVWTKAMKRLAVLVSTSIKYNEPLLLVGETGCGKTTVCQTIAEYLGKKLITVNAHQNTETSDILGAQRPVRNRYETRSRLFNNLVNAFNQLNVKLELDDIKLDELITKFNSLTSYAGINEETLKAIEEDKINSNILFEWSDGPLIHAMKDGEFFLLDEISLADDSVLERLNSVLEPERSLLLAEKGTDDAFIVGHEDFQFLATMNPGGDYGKKELSPALRNRFTEIWVPSMDDFNDVKQIVDNKLIEPVKYLTDPLIKFSEFYGKKFGGGNVTSGIISLRDILAWVQFINTCVKNASVEGNIALLHGAAMVFIDSLGTNNTAYLAEDENNLKAEKLSCVKKLSELSNQDLLPYYISDFNISLTNENLSAGSFSIPRVRNDIIDDFLLHAPATSANAMRVIRAMQVHKPILLEGSPGVGKTSLVSAIAKATGNKLIRINLSEQTDLVDLFGSDAPAEGGKTGEFVWRDAPFLRAMQKGEWVLLDEMNLASQSVLEGLNACLDHRGEAYIPELDKSFTCHPEFTVFAAQNPQYQGGGRKGLPKSFVNRFTVVYVDILKKEDLNMISQHLYPNIDKEICNKVIEFMSKLEEEVIINKKWGSSGGPWEFNLRDTLRWLALYSSRSIVENINPSDFFNMIICHRFRSTEDKLNASRLFESIFGEIVKRDNYFKITENFIQSGSSIIKRTDTVKFNDGSKSIPLQCNYQFLEAAISCVNNNLPLILTGPSNSGKTELIRFLAKAVGAKLNEFAMNSDVDSMDILGGYEQVDLTRGISSIITRLKLVLQQLLLLNLKSSNTEPMILQQSLELFGFIENKEINLSNFREVYEFLRSFVSVYSNDELIQLANDCSELVTKMNEETPVKFEWFDGLLVEAVEKGYWLILDNANLCSPSVLDRLNSLLEVNGSLIINECSSEDGKPRILQPHPNFRLFLTVDPKYGELSRAMRNRGIELFMDELESRATKFDKSQIKSLNPIKSENDVEIAEGSNVTDKFDNYPTAAFLAPNFAIDRLFVELDDIQQSESDLEISTASLSGLIQFNSFNILESWGSFIIKSKEFTNKDYALKIISKIKFLNESGILNSLSRVYKPVQERLGETSINLLPNQTLNPLINSYLINFESTEPLYLFQVSSGILNCQLEINKVEQKAMNGNMNELSYVERSAAFKLGRTIKNVPRLDVYSFLLSIIEFISETFIEVSGEGIFKNEHIYRTLFDLLIIWNCLYETSHHQNESQLRVYRDLVSAWYTQYSSNEIIANSIKKLITGIESFSHSFDLKTGYLMENIWERFRSNYPDSKDNWINIIELLKIFNEFDMVAKEQNLESLEQVCSFQDALLKFYDSIINGNVNNEEFQVIKTNLNNGIIKLKEIVSNFSVKRKNDFESEFDLLTTFTQLNESLEVNHPKTDIIRLSSLAGRPLNQFVKSRDSNPFNPYPSIFDNICRFNNGYESFVSNLFDNTFSRMILQKSSRFNETSGKFLQMKLNDTKFFVKELINNSSHILAEVKENFGNLLIAWILEIIKVNNENEEYIKFISKLSYKDLVEVSGNIEALEDLIQEFSEPITTCFKQYFIPSIKIVVNSTSKGQIGKAYVLFACGAIQLYLPSSAFDPAIREHVIYNKFLTQIKLSEELVNTWSKVNDVIHGDEEALSLRLLKSERQPELPQKPRVFREGPVDNLFEEWKAFMDSSVDAEHIESLLKSAVELTEESEQLLNMFQNNSSQLIHRLDTNFQVFADLNDILKGYIFALKIGFDLVDMQKKESNRYETDLLSVSNASKITSFNEIEKMFNDFAEFTKKQSPDSPISEKVMIFFIKVALAHGIDVSNAVINQALQSIYYRWTLRKLKETEENMQKESLYKFEDPDADIEGDFKTLFPDFEEVMDTDIKSIKNNQSFDDVYFELAKAYTEAFTGKNNYNVGLLVNEGNKLATFLSENTGDYFASGKNDASNLVASIYGFAEVFGKFSQVESNTLDFYRESSPKETRRAIEILHNIVIFTNKLLLEWPEHATLRDIVRVCNEFLDYSLNTPIARQLQKIEQIYTFISEWEKYAHSKVSLKVYFDQLTNLIVSWRRLELSTWKELFNHEDKALEVNIGKWWFHLFETIIVPLYSKGPESNLGNVLHALHIFCSQTTFGEFRFRLNLVRAFKEHAFKVEGKGETFNAISNFITFYEQFVSTIDDKIFAQRKKLEKDINEVILLASWKDVNIDALKQSARRSHNSLYKIVRKYRSLLMTSVSSIIEQGISEDHKPLVETKQIPGVVGDVLNVDIAELNSKVSTWNTRPSRLQDITTVDNNLSIYIKRISEESLPSLYDYAKEILDDSTKLKNETPSVYKEDTKKLIASLKNQKAKLLSSTLKELRRIGLKTTSKADVKQVQSSSNHILANSITFSNTLLEGSDTYFYRIIEILPRLRSSMGQLTDDVPQPDLEKGFAVAENLIHSLIIKRKPLVALSDSISGVEHIVASLEKVSQLYDTPESISPATIIGSVKLNLESIKDILTWLPKVLDFAIESLELSKLFTDPVTTNIFYNFKSKLLSSKYKFDELNDISSDSTVKFIEEFESIIVQLKTELIDWSSTNVKFGFFAKMVLNWLDLRNTDLFISSTSVTNLKVVEDVEKSLRDLTNSILIVVQKTRDIQSVEIIEDDDNWFDIIQKRISNYIKTTHHKNILNKLNEIKILIEGVAYDSETSRLVSGMTAFTIPIIKHYFQLITSILSNTRQNYVESSHAAYILISILYSLSTKGFCSPEAPSEEKTDDNLQDGTGLGDGEGATNNSKDVEDDEDLSEQAQTDNKEKDEDNENEDENDDAVDMEGDMAGDLEDASDQDKSDDESDEGDEEMDEQIDDIDDLDPNEVDEKMWDEEAKENDKEKDSDQVPNSNNDDDVVANEDEDDKKSQDKKENKDPNDEDLDENEKNEEENDDEADDEKDVGEQEDDVKHDEENEQMDDHVPESEALDLPEDMNLDGDDEDEKEEQGEDNKFDDMEIENDKDDDEKENDDNENDEEEDTEMGDAADDTEAVEEGEEEKQDESEEGKEDNKPGEEGIESEDEALGEKDKEDKEGGGDQEDQETAEGIDGALDEDAHEDVDIESAVKQEAGERGEGADNQVVEEQDDLGATGASASTQPQDQEKQEEDNTQMDESNEMARESMKELGDSLKEFHRRHQEIQEASREDKEETEQKANERPDEFEHVDGENTNTDTQALGAAEKDQMQSIDEDKAIDDDIEESQEAHKEEPEIKQEHDGMEVDDENLEELNENDPDADFEGKTKGGFINDRSKVKQEEGGLMNNEIDDIEIDTDFNIDDAEVQINENDVVPMSLETARDLWRQSELATQELASGLCEQLRLILEPTLATKLRGDYKTGKRLNMKRIIPYIASEFRKDKIWLRRTKPSKRQYQIMIAVDDSKSMSESKSTELAFNSIALVSKALSQLESGGLSVVRFGEDVKVVHPFDRPFNNQETGSKIFQYFDFQQTRTDIKNLVNKSLRIFENAKITSNNDLWQLQIILSDGVCEDHETIQALVRRARESRIMLVFVVIDGINSNESILDMSQVKYEFDENGNSALKVDKYLDSFPFEFYVVVKNINELPEMLSLILRQYFSEITSVNS